VRLVLFAYQAVGHACLDVLLDLREEIACVITHRDRPEERIWFPSVADLARSARIPVRYAEDLDGAAIEALVRDADPDVIYSFYYRSLLRRAVLERARAGAFNLHGSLLPRYRGRVPVNWVIIRGEAETGVTLHHMVPRADAGDIVGQKRIPIAPRETVRTLYAKVIPAAVELVREYHPLIREGRAPRIPQDEARATTFGGRRPEDGEIDWSQDARSIDALIRGVTRPFPGAFGLVGGRRLRIWEAEPVAGPAPGRPGDVVGRAGRAHAGPFHPAYGLRIACGSGCLDVIESDWEEEA